VLLPPDARSLCLFVEPLLNKIPGYASGKEGCERKVSDLKCYPDTCLDERRKAIKVLRLVNQSGDYDPN
jgi:hypothetical protein